MKSEKEKIYDITYMWNLKKNDTNDLIYKTETQTSKTNLRLPQGKRGKYKLRV